MKAAISRCRCARRDRRRSVSTRSTARRDDLAPSPGEPSATRNREKHPPAGASRETRKTSRIEVSPRRTRSHWPDRSAVASLPDRPRSVRIVTSTTATAAHRGDAIQRHRHIDPSEGTGPPWGRFNCHVMPSASRQCHGKGQEGRWQPRGSRNVLIRLVRPLPRVLGRENEPCLKTAFPLYKPSVSTAGAIVRYLLDARDFMTGICSTSPFYTASKVVDAADASTFPEEDAKPTGGSGGPVPASGGPCAPAAPRQSTRWAFGRCRSRGR